MVLPVGLNPNNNAPMINMTVDVMVVDVQCVMPGLAGVAKHFHTRLITTSDKARLPGVDHVSFDERHALDTARAETKNDSQNAFAWFNLGSNLVYFDSYAEAATAYDTARQIGLPQRMLRYQFGPFFAYFNLNRNDDLLAATFTPNDPLFHVYSKDIPRGGVNGLGRPTLLELAPGSKMQAAGPLSASAEATAKIAVPDRSGSYMVSVPPAGSI